MFTWWLARDTLTLEVIVLYIINLRSVTFAWIICCCKLYLFIIYLKSYIKFTCQLNRLIQCLFKWTNMEVRWESLFTLYNFANKKWWLKESLLRITCILPVFLCSVDFSCFNSCHYSMENIQTGSTGQLWRAFSWTISSEIYFYKFNSQVRCYIYISKKFTLNSS